MIFEIVTCIWHRAGDGIAMGAGGWIVQSGDDTCLDCTRNKMLKAASLLVDLVPLHAQHIDKETFCQSMPAQHCFSGLVSGLGQCYLALVIHLHEAIAHQPLEHFGHRGRSDAKLLCQSCSNHHLIFHIHVIDGL